MSVFRSRDEAERSTLVAADFVRERLRDFEIERIDVRSGALVVSAAARSCSTADLGRGRSGRCYVSGIGGGANLGAGA